jgi:GMP synthase-like glutamine amidotransferase
MKIHVLIHADFERPGYIDLWAKNNNFELVRINCWESPVFPEIDDVDRLLIMGGPMGVYETDKYVWLKDELVFIKKAIDAGKRVLGICLGSQLIAAAMGSKVYPMQHKEIGWFMITWNKAALMHNLTKGVSRKTKVFHHHGDTFDLPQNATRMASSEGCVNQAYVIGKHVLALQFHLEIIPELLADMMKHGGELTPGPFVQTKERIDEGIYDAMQNHADLATILENVYIDK